MSDIQEIIEELPQCIQELSNSASQLAHHHKELRLRYVDSSIFLLSILRLGDSNGSAQWLHSAGLTEHQVLRIIKEDYASGARSSSRTAIGGYTVAAKQMFMILTGVEQFKSRSTYIAKVLEAVVLSESLTVERIFASVSLSISDVKRTLNISAAPLASRVI
jgi:hypothetical protein